MRRRRPSFGPVEHPGWELYAAATTHARRGTFSPACRRDAKRTAHGLPRSGPRARRHQRAPLRSAPRGVADPPGAATFISRRASPHAIPAASHALPRRHLLSRRSTATLSRKPSGLDSRFTVASPRGARFTSGLRRPGAPSSAPDSVRSRKRCVFAPSAPHLQRAFDIYRRSRRGRPRCSAAAEVLRSPAHRFCLPARRIDQSLPHRRKSRR